jgi:hypothetical protein
MIIHWHEPRDQTPTVIGTFSLFFSGYRFRDFANPVVERLAPSTSETRNTKLSTHLATDFGFSLFAISGVAMSCNSTSRLPGSRNPNYRNPEKSTLSPTTLRDFGISLALCLVPLSTGFPICRIPKHRNTSVPLPRKINGCGSSP